MADEKFIFTSGAKKKLGIMALVGVVLLVIGIFMVGSGGHHAEGETVEHAFHWSKRVWADLWINNMFFVGLSIIGVFFVALQYVAQAGWGTAILRVPDAFGTWLPFAGILTLLVFLVANHDLFHWTHEYLYDQNDPRYDPVIAGKEGYLNFWFYLARMIAYFVLWYVFFRLIRKQSLLEDLHGGTAYYHKMVKLSAIFIVIFALSSSTAAWDWVMSIDTHWYSTMFGWYVFASWFVSGLAAITLALALLKENGYLPQVNSNHLHNMGLYIFAFSIFWTYIWFAQFLLIYYANIPEEAVYFFERLGSDHYGPVFYANLFMNFVFPFLLLMTRDSKRQLVFLKIVCVIVLVGHWLDFYLMIAPGTLKTNGGLGFLEVGITLVYAAAFIFVVLMNLAKVPLVPKNHPMLEESVHHHV